MGAPGPRAPLKGFGGWTQRARIEQKHSLNGTRSADCASCAKEKHFRTRNEVEKIWRPRGANCNVFTLGRFPRMNEEDQMRLRVTAKPAAP